MPAITQKTTMVRKEDTKPDWFVIDADGRLVGHLATQIATVLMGKHKADYTPHVECGDFVVVVNAKLVRFSGNPANHDWHPHYTTKMEFRTYERYSGYPSGRKVFTAAQMLERKPEMILHEAVRRMLPKNKLGRHMLKKLRLFNEAEHDHQSQQPKPFPEHLLPKK